MDFFLKQNFKCNLKNKLYMYTNKMVINIDILTTCKWMNNVHLYAYMYISPFTMGHNGDRPSTCTLSSRPCLPDRLYHVRGLPLGTGDVWSHVLHRVRGSRRPLDSETSPVGNRLCQVSLFAWPLFHKTSKTSLHWLTGLRTL